MNDVKENPGKDSSPRRRAVALVITGGVALSLMAGYAYRADRAVFEKLLAELVMPLGLIWLFVLSLGVFAVARGQRLMSRAWFLLALLIWVCGNEYLVNGWVGRLERRYTNIRPLEEGDFDAVVLLGGGANVGPNGSCQLSVSGDRVMLAVRLFNNGQTDRIVCTGSRIPAIDRSGRDPQDVAAEILTSAGIPSDVIEQIDGINTYQEVRSLSQYFEPGQRIGLVTSAWHMGRVERLSKRAGFEFVPLPADFVHPANHRFQLLDWIPDARALFRFHLFLREQLAAIVGR